MTHAIDYEAIAQRFLEGNVLSIGLFGSHARGDFGRYSDIDVVRFGETWEGPESQTYLIDDHFVVVSNVTSKAVSNWFSCPDAATQNLAGVRSAKVLVDSDAYLAGIIDRALAFEWDDAMQEKANELASSLMVGWIEEVQKSLEGLRRNDLGRLLNGKHGLTFGMLNVMRIRLGVFLSGDNGLFPEVLEALGHNSKWSTLCKTAFGVDGNATLQQEVAAGLTLYSLTAELLHDVLTRDDALLIDEITLRISREGI